MKKKTHSSFASNLTRNSFSQRSKPFFLAADSSQGITTALYCVLLLIYWCINDKKIRNEEMNEWCRYPFHAVSQDMQHKRVQHAIYEERCFNRRNGTNVLLDVFTFCIFYAFDVYSFSFNWACKFFAFICTLFLHFCTLFISTQRFEYFLFLFGCYNSTLSFSCFCFFHCKRSVLVKGCEEFFIFSITQFTARHRKFKTRFSVLFFSLHREKCRKIMTLCWFP